MFSLRFFSKLISVFSLVLFTGLFSLGFYKSVSAAVTGPVIVKLKETSALPTVFQTNAQKLFPWSKNPSLSRIYSLKNTDISQAKKYLEKNFEYVELSRSFKSQSLEFNDPGFTTNLSDTDRQWGLVQAKFLDAWSKTTGSEEFVIAVIDTGIDVTHIDLQNAKFVPGFDFVNNLNLSGTENSDDNGHGTLVTGIISASPNNGIGTIGAVWQSTIMPVKALDKSGSGNSSLVSQAIVYAVDHGASILNLSMGGLGLGQDQTLNESIIYAFNKGALIVAASGNDSIKEGLRLDLEPSYPACNDNDSNMVIGVTAIDYRGIKPAFANYGKNCIDVSAPGKRILSTINYDPISGRYSPNSYAYASGTSLSVPYVVSESLMIWSLNPKASNKQVRDHLLKSVDNVDSLNLNQCGGVSCAGLIGTGTINAFKAVSSAIPVMQISEGDLVRTQETGQLFFLNGGKKHKVSDLVLKLRFDSKIIKVIPQNLIKDIPSGTFAMPPDGTLVKSDSSQTVFFISSGLKSPVTREVFAARGLNFLNVLTFSEEEVSSWLTGKFLSPPEGFLLKGKKNPTVYWVVKGELHAMNSAFYKLRGLDIFPITEVADEDIKSYLLGEDFVL